MSINYSYKKTISELLRDYDSDITKYTDPQTVNENNLIPQESLSEAVELVTSSGHIQTYLNWLDGYFSTTELLQSMNLPDEEIDRLQALYMEKNQIGVKDSDGKKIGGFGILLNEVASIFQDIEDPKILNAVRTMLDDEMIHVFKTTNYHYSTAKNIKENLEHSFFTDILAIPTDYLKKNKSYLCIKLMSKDSTVEDQKAVLPFIDEITENEKNRMFKGLCYVNQYCIGEEAKAKAFTSILEFCQIVEFTPPSTSMSLFKEKLKPENYMSTKELEIFFQTNDTSNKIKLALRNNVEEVKDPDNQKNVESFKI